MKKIIIIDAYIANKEKENILRECISSFRKLNIDILLVSHSIIKQELIKLVDYYIYDKNNQFNNNNGYVWRVFNDVEIRLYLNKSHEYSIIRAMRGALQYAKAMGYDYFYFTEFDNIIADVDIEWLEKSMTNLHESNKLFIFVTLLTFQSDKSELNI